MMEPTRGDLVTPVIQLERKLGQGGMGSVWLAQHLKFQVSVVVKFIGHELLDHPEALARFEREAALAAQAKSPHVVQIYDHGVSLLGLPYIAMELLEGEDLAARIARDGSIEPRIFSDWLRQACAGLGKAHARGIVHRDVKPENIFLCDEAGDVLVKVLDFGIAKSTSTAGSFSGTRTGMMMGTAYYMSPEQAMGSKDVDFRTDLWALGVVAYYALTGCRVFDGDSIGAVVWAITSGPVTPPSAQKSDLTPAIDAWMMRALHRDPQGRFESARAMADAFSAAISQPAPSRTQGALLDEGMSSTVAVSAASSADHNVVNSTQANFGQTKLDAAGIPLKPGSKRLLATALGVAGFIGAVIFFLSGGTRETPLEATSPSLLLSDPTPEREKIEPSLPLTSSDPQPVKAPPETPSENAQNDQKRVAKDSALPSTPKRAASPPVASATAPAPPKKTSPGAKVSEETKNTASPASSSPLKPVVAKSEPVVKKSEPATKKSATPGGGDLGGRL